MWLKLNPFSKPPFVIDQRVLPGKGPFIGPGTVTNVGKVPIHILAWWLVEQKLG